MLCGYAKREWSIVLAIGLMFTVTFTYVGLWPIGLIAAIATVAVLTFFRDPYRRPPTQRGVIVAPADGKITSIHRVERYEPFDGPAVCVRIFLSVLDVHINRSPCHGIVDSITPKEGQYLNALNPDSAEVNNSLTMVLLHPIRNHPVAAVRQVSGLLARTIVCDAKIGDVLQRGQKYGMIKLGSTTELYIPASAQPRIAVQDGQMVQGGLTVVANVGPRNPGNPGEE